MATPGHKGLYVSWQSGSQQIAIMAAALMGYALNRSLSPAAIAEWGWRIPFLIGCLIVPFVLVIRQSLQETEEFLAKIHRPSVAEIFRSMVVTLTEVMPRDVRTVGFSLAYSLATALGGFTPAISTFLIQVTANKASPGLWMPFAALCGLTAAWYLFRAKPLTVDRSHAQP